MMCKKTFTFKLIKNDTSCVLSIDFTDLSSEKHIRQILGKTIKIEPAAKCKLLFIGKKESKLTLEDIYNLSNLLRCLVGSILTWDIIGSKLLPNDPEDLEGYLLLEKSD